MAQRPTLTYEETMPKVDIDDTLNQTQHYHLIDKITYVSIIFPNVLFRDVAEMRRFFAESMTYKTRHWDTTLGNDTSRGITFVT